MTHHRLKSHPDSFELLTLRTSTIQLRKNDRGFRAGDRVSFYEFCPKQKIFLGATVPDVEIESILETHEGLTPGWCLLVLALPQTNIRRWNAGLVGKTELPPEEVLNAVPV